MLRSHHRGPEGVFAAVEDQHAAVPAPGKERAAPGIQVRRVRGRTDVRALAQAAAQVKREVPMNRRSLTSVDTLAIAFATALLAPALAAARQSAQPAATAAAKTSTVPRMPDGRPDLQGVWDFRTITPMERPEVARHQGLLHRRGSGELRKGRESPPESRPDRSREGRPGLSGARRHSVQRVLVRPRQQDRRDASAPR